MANAVSLFSQLLRHFPRTEFALLVQKHSAERHAKGFTCRDQFIAMLFCHLARADSLREICGGLSCCLGKLAHLGMGRAPKRSTLSYANEHRPAALYEDLFWTATERFRGQGRLGGGKTGFRFKNRLLSLDSTTVSLCLNLFPWAKFRRAKGGVKVHVMLDHADYMPSFVLITEARRHDVTAAGKVRLAQGSIVAMDRAYNDFSLFARWTEEGVFFVTRMKENTVYEVVEERRTPQNRNILSDQVIRLVGVKAAAKCPHLLRRVVVWDAEKERRIVLLTNHLDFGATTIAAIDQELWAKRIVWSDHFVENIADAYRKRKSAVPRRPRLDEANRLVSSAGNPQTKAEETKEDQTRPAAPEDDCKRFSTLLKGQFEALYRNATGKEYPGQRSDAEALTLAWAKLADKPDRVAWVAQCLTALFARPAAPPPRSLLYCVRKLVEDYDAEHRRKDLETSLVTHKRLVGKLQEFIPNPKSVKGLFLKHGPEALQKAYDSLIGTNHAYSTPVFREKFFERLRQSPTL